MARNNSKDLMKEDFNRGKRDAKEFMDKMDIDRAIKKGRGVPMEEENSNDDNRVGSGGQTRKDQ